MSWEAIGAVGEILGALGVIITLIYLSFQIKEGIRTSRAATRQAISDSLYSLPKATYSDAEFRKTLIAATEGKSLDTDQTVQLNAYCFAAFRMYENIHYQHRNGMLSDSEWASFRLNLKAVLQIGAWRDYWDREKEIYTQAYRDEVDLMINELEREPVIAPGSVIHPND